MKDSSPLQHVAFIMDGNRRWAKNRGLPVIEGYREGEKRIFPIAEKCTKLGIPFATFYTLSLENLAQRPRQELKALVGLVQQELPNLHQKLESIGGQLNLLGDINAFPEKEKKLIEEAFKRTHEREDIIINLALGYSGRDEIKRAVQRLMDSGVNRQQVTEALISNHLDTSRQPDPDLIIRAGARSRSSNFLPWQGAYSELYFSDKMWPDFTVPEFEKTLLWYQNQIRTFGK